MLSRSKAIEIDRLKSSIANIHNVLISYVNLSSRGI